MHWTKDLKAGDEVVGNFPLSYGRERGKPNLISLRVEKIGRVWLHLKHVTGGWQTYRVKIGDNEIDGCGYASPGRVYRTAADFETHAERIQLWKSFQKHVEVMRWSGPPVDIPTENIRSAAQLLGFDMSKEG